VGYYRGDGVNYYRGDYYRGDPFLGALVGGAIKMGAGRAIGRAGAFVGKALGRAGKAVGVTARDAAPATIGGAVGYTLGQRSTGMGPLPQMGPLSAGPQGPLMLMQKRRRMNPLNPRALRRALRRAEGFEKFAARTVNALYKQVGGRRTRVFKKRSCK